MPRRISRRAFLLGTAGSATAVSLGALTARDWAWARDRTSHLVLDASGTTLEATVRPVGSGPYRTTGAGPGEPFLVRADLREPRRGREDRRRPLAAFVQFTDQHVIDAQSPARVEFLDHTDSLFSSGFRPQELLTTQVATSMVERVNALSGGPVTGRALDCAVCTGDNIDNQQVNELDWILAVLDGGTVTPDSGALGTYEGVQDGVGVEPFWWHPEPGIDDAYKATGYPDVPGLLDRAIAPFTSPGLSIPWYSAYGNHDCNIQGNAARSDALDQILTGDRKMVGLPAGESGVAFILRIFDDSPGVLADLQAGTIPFRSVAPDAGRRTATVTDWIGAHRASSTGDHGYDASAQAEGRLYYEFEVAPGVVGLCLDTTNHAGGVDGSAGSIGEGQAAWLTERLAAHHTRHLAPDGSEVRSGGDDRLVVVFSHHTPGTMDADDPDPAHPDERRLLGDEVIALLHRYPNVIGWVVGHTHRNAVRPHPDPAGRTGGFWEICTASHVDWPQQARVIEVVDNDDDTLSIFTTMIEHIAGPTVDRDGADHLALAGLSRELGLNDSQIDPLPRAADLTDRNVELLVAAPFLAPTVAPPPSVPVPPPAVGLPATPSYTG